VSALQRKEHIGPRRSDDAEQSIAATTPVIVNISMFGDIDASLFAFLEPVHGVECVWKVASGSLIAVMCGIRDDEVRGTEGWAGSARWLDPR
jgi:hypothetical protein